LGQGYYDTAGATVQIEDTEISNFDDITHEFYSPGDDVTLFPDNVEISGEVGNIELFGPNEPEYDSWVGPYAANASGTDTTKLELDLVFPAGLYFAGDSGDLTAKTVTVSIEYREIDDTGAPVGVGTYTAVAFSKTLATNTPQRFTTSIAVASARYEVQVRRTNNTETDTSKTHRTQEAIHWVALRAFLPSTKDYGDVTLLAIRARASNNLNNSSSNRVNVITTRKLPIWDSGTETWSAPTVTRSLVWAFCDALRAEYGGRLPDTYLDLATLDALNTDLEAAGENFDFVFDKAMSLWTMLTTIARAGNCLPIVSGSQISMTIDEVKTVPTALFSKENMVEGSFSKDFKLWTDDEYDGVEVEFIDGTTYATETVLCLVGDDVGDNPQQIKLPGVTDRARAWRVGMRVREATKRRRGGVRFSTGLEGHIPNFNDLIFVSHDLPQWGQSGRVVSISGTSIIVDNELDWSAGGTFKIAFRTLLGEELGPFTVTEGADAFTAEMGAPLSAPSLALLASGDNVEPPIYAFGVESGLGAYCRVVSVNHGGGEQVDIEAIEDDATIYSHDAESPPAAVTGSLPAKVADLPTVTGLSVRDIPSRTPISQATWNPALGATSYVVQGSFNGTDWSVLGVTSQNFLNFTVAPGNYYVRVAAINVGQGPWTTAWSGTVGDTSGIDTSGVLIIPPTSGEAMEANQFIIQDKAYLDLLGLYQP
jgi:hypothetical protein